MKLAILAAAVVGASLVTPAVAHAAVPRWTACQRTADDTTGKAIDDAGGRCADITVPLDHNRPHGRAITVAVSRIPATKTKLGTLFLNGGGPAPALDTGLFVTPALRDLAAHYDLVAMDPRFTGRSRPAIDCGWDDVGEWRRSAGSDRAGFDRSVAFNRALAAECHRAHAAELPHASTRNIARDMDVVRRALGERRVSYLGYSYGTVLGVVYNELFPGRLDRVVLDSPIDLRAWGPMFSADRARANEGAMREWAAYTAARDATYHLGATPEAVLAAARAVFAAAERNPLRLGGYTVDGHTAPLIPFARFWNGSDEGNALVAAEMRLLADAASGAVVEPTAGLGALLAGFTTGADSASGSANLAIMCADGVAPRDPERYWRDIQRHRVDEPVFGPIERNVRPCAFLPPGREPATRVTRDLPALLVGATRDNLAPYRQAVALRGDLPSSRLVTVDVRKHVVFGHLGNTCVDDTVRAYLAGGALPPDRTCP
ncbi:alpha/beta fold hydrolase [Saccharothrix obliqua]|uniref:alpha/beta fold hydrolase n=1 Tax=Saccharothrix obliqua TaxID=2861747 RepID=UPI001C600B77|nr:alpha/beta hydrolase [Saccharothrix obliqua]MBW4718015.1 alpha/beta hydrolase [Saccharothrix obliqua]